MTPAAKVILPSPPWRVAVQQTSASRPPAAPPVSEEVLQAARDQAREELEARRQDFELAAEALVRARQELEDLRDRLRREAEANLLDLALEVARKVVMQEIKAARCDIEPILHEALAHVAPGAEVEIRLNPDDLACLRKRQDAEEQRGREEDSEEEKRNLCVSESPRPLPTDLNLIADPAVGRGECLVRTAQGVIESRIDAHFQEIAQALRD